MLATLQSRPADVVSIISLASVQHLVSSVQQLVFQLPCRISCISSLHAFRHLLPAFFHGSCCSCMYLLPASLLPWQLLFMHESAACLLPWQLLFMHISAACLLFCNCCMLLYAFMLLPKASHLWCFIVISILPLLLCVITHTGTGDLVDVLEVVESVSDWKRLGLTLGLLYQPTLTDIETYRRGKPDECRIDMLSAWLQQQDNVRVPS